MNVRVLELLQRPENISAEDISVLQNEISSAQKFGRTNDGSRTK